MPRISIPTQEEINTIATMFANVHKLANQMGLGVMDYSIADLIRIQKIIDTKATNDSSYLKRSLGIAFACVFIENHDGYQWRIFEDEDGSESCIRYMETEIIFFPEPFIASKMQKEDEIDVLDLYRQTSEILIESEIDLD